MRLHPDGTSTQFKLASIYFICYIIILINVTASGRGSVGFAVLQEEMLFCLACFKKKTPPWRVPGRGLGLGVLSSDQLFKSKRSKFMTLVQAATKSVTNFALASSLA